MTEPMIVISNTRTPEEVAADLAGVDAERTKVTETEPNQPDKVDGAATKDEGSEKQESKEEAKAEKDSSPSEEGEVKPDSKKKGKGGFKKRLARQELELQAERRRNQELAARLAALEGKTAKPEPENLNIEDAEPQEEAYDKHGDWMKAWTRWESRRQAKEILANEFKVRDQASQRQQVQRTKAEFAAEFDRNAESFAKEHPDYWERLKDAELRLDSAGAALPPHAAGAIVESENGPAVLYELAKNPKEFKRLCELPEREAWKEVGRIEARLAAAKAAESDRGTAENTRQETPRRRESPPIRGVSGTGGPAGVPKGPPFATQREYEDWRKAGGGR